MANVYLRALREMADAQEAYDAGQISREALEDAQTATELAFLAHQKTLADMDKQKEKEGQK